MYNDIYGIDPAFAGTAMSGLFAGIMIFSLILSLISIISYWKVFVKAGKPGWASIIPIYNTIVMIEIAKLPLWYIVLFLVPIANIFALFKINIEMAKKFGKSTGYGVGMTLIPIICVPMLAFSDNVYEDNNTSIDSTINRTFDATNIINASNNIEKENDNQNNSLENNIPVENIDSNQNIIVEPNVDSVIPEQINNNSIEVQNEIPVAPLFTEQESIIVEPTIEENSIPEQNEVNDSVTAFNSTPIMTEVNNSVVEPIIEVEQAIVEPVQNNENVNAFNVVPEMPINQEIEPTIEPVVVEPIQTEIQLNETLTNSEGNNNVESSKRVCKNCGNELPSIVSICPNCGTDNE